jgi:hypothetical protein
MSASRDPANISVCYRWIPGETGGILVSIVLGIIEK